LILIVAILIYIITSDTYNRKSPQITPSDNNLINHSPATSEQQKAGNDTKANSVGAPPASTPIPSGTKKNIQVTITAAEQNGSTLQIRVLIGAVESKGTCTLALTRAGETSVTKTAGTQALSSTSTCQGFDIPTSELSAGTWNALITYDSSTLAGSATKSIIIQ